MSNVESRLSAPDLRVETREGSALREALGPLAELRMRVFFEFPYLYVGSKEYEEQYLKVYVQSERCRVILVWDGARIVGASTAIPLSDAPREVQEPFERAGLDLKRIDYFGESVLLSEFRGRGLGRKFFELREAHALAHGLAVCAFCAVERPLDHPLRPRDYVPHDAFWARCGYQKVPEMRAEFTWQDRNEPAPSGKSMMFWLKRLVHVDETTQGVPAL